jgi:hypothetical protein
MTTCRRYVEDQDLLNYGSCQLDDLGRDIVSKGSDDEDDDDGAVGRQQHQQQQLLLHQHRPSTSGKVRPKAVLGGGGASGGVGASSSSSAAAAAAAATAASASSLSSSSVAAAAGTTSAVDEFRSGTEVELYLFSRMLLRVWVSSVHSVSFLHGILLECDDHCLTPDGVEAPVAGVSRGDGGGGGGGWRQTGRQAA